MDIRSGRDCELAIANNQSLPLSNHGLDHKVVWTQSLTQRRLRVGASLYRVCSSTHNFSLFLPGAISILIYVYIYC